jgi:antitoxin component of MazEF toxin-antitoxin module
MLDREIIMKPEPLPPKNPKKPKYTLEKLLEALTPEQLHGEIDFGAPVGKEIIDG